MKIDINTEELGFEKCKKCDSHPRVFFYANNDYKSFLQVDCWCPYEKYFFLKDLEPITFQLDKRPLGSEFLLEDLFPRIEEGLKYLKKEWNKSPMVEKELSWGRALAVKQAEEM